MKTFRSCKLSILLFLLFFCSSVCGTAAFAAPAQELDTTAPSASFEQGRAFKSGAIKVIDLHGTWHEMGRQYGHFMSGELREIWSAKLQPFMAEHPDKSILMKKMAQKNAQAAPYKYREIIQGMAETSGLPLSQLELVDMVERVAGITQCSALAVWGDYAKGALIYGRNYDFYPSFNVLSNDIVVSVYHPADGSLAVATIGYAGEIYAVNALNESGIFVELNNGSPSSSGKRASNRLHATTSLFSVMEDADSLTYLDSFFATTNTNAAYLIGAADAKSARSYEWDISGTQRGDSTTPPGVMVMTNHFVAPEWNRPLPTDEKSWQSLTRRKNLLNLAEEYKGKIDASCMMELIERDIASGGSKSELTRYELTIQPENRLIWLKIPQAADWTKINLNHLFTRQQKEKQAA